PAWRYLIWSSTVTLAVALRLTAASTALRPPMMIAFTVSPYSVTARPHGRTGQWSPVGELSTSVYPPTLGRIETPGNNRPRGLRHGVRLLHAGIFLLPISPDGSGDRRRSGRPWRPRRPQ